MRVLRIAAVFAVLAGPTYAQQMPNINLLPEVKTLTPEEKEAEAARDKAYKESLRKIPDAKGSTDPWGNVRSDAPKTAAPAKPKTKTRQRANQVGNPLSGRPPEPRRAGWSMIRESGHRFSEMFMSNQEARAE